MNRRFVFGLFVILLLLGGLMFVMAYWGRESYYQEAYAPQVRQSLEYRRLEQEQRDERAGGRSVEPRAAGFRESEIDKTEGNRYQTF